jgi:hypothetical protein
MVQPPEFKVHVEALTVPAWLGEKVTAPEGANDVPFPLLETLTEQLVWEFTWTNAKSHCTLMTVDSRLTDKAKAWLPAVEFAAWFASPE